MTAFSHTANNWVHDTLPNSVVHLKGNLCTLLTLKKSANAWNAALYKQ